VPLGHSCGHHVARPRGIRTKSAWLLVVPFLVFARPAPGAMGGGAALAVLGLLLRGWAAGTIRKDEALTTTGPYARLRHPLYAGSFLIGAGLGIAGGHWIWPLLVAGFFALGYRRTIAEERARLTELFGARYSAYAASVPGLIPRLTPFRAEAQPPTGFGWSRYLRNREWEALLGAAAAFGILAAKMLWLG
jgi:protein-S-isoprenylcysteine O-methyltransferase Ste14